MFLGDLLIFVLILTGVAVVAIFLNKRLLTLLLSSIFLLLVAIRLNIGQMYLMGTVLLALPLASYMVGWLGGRHLEVSRSVPESAYEGEQIPVRVEVTSPLSLFSGLVRVNKHLPRHIRPVPDSEALSAIPAGVRQEYRVRLERRGVYRLGGATVSMNDPLGIFMLNRRFALSSNLVVYPTPLPHEVVQRMGQSSTGWLVHATSAQRGEEDDIYGTREYRIGDDLRRIHWKSSARRNSLVVVERQRGSSGRLLIALDVRSGSVRGTERDNSLERAIKLATTLMDSALRRGDAVGLLAPAASGGFLPVAAGESQRLSTLDILARVQADGVQPLGEALQKTGIEPGVNVVIITGAPTEDMLEAVEHLKQRNVRVVVAPVPAPTANAIAPVYPSLEHADFVARAEDLGAPALPWPDMDDTEGTTALLSPLNA